MTAEERAKNLYADAFVQGRPSQESVAFAIMEAVAEEREACANLCFKRMPNFGMDRSNADPGVAYELGRIDQAQADAAAIRARG